MIIKQQNLSSSWTDYRDSLIAKGQDKLLTEFQNQGIQVFIKTDITPELKVFDSAVVDAGGKPLLNVGVRVIDKKGKELINYGENPSINPLKSLAVYGGLGTLFYFALKGAFKG